MTDKEKLKKELLNINLNEIKSKKEELKNINTIIRLTDINITDVDNAIDVLNKKIGDRQADKLSLKLKLRALSESKNKLEESINELEEESKLYNKTPTKTKPFKPTICIDFKLDKTCIFYRQFLDYIIQCSKTEYFSIDFDKLSIDIKTISFKKNYLENPFKQYINNLENLMLFESVIDKFNHSISKYDGEVTEELIEDILKVRKYVKSHVALCTSMSNDYKYNLNEYNKSLYGNYKPNYKGIRLNNDKIKSYIKEYKDNKRLKNSMFYLLNYIDNIFLNNYSVGYSFVIHYS